MSSFGDYTNGKYLGKTNTRAQVYAKLIITPLHINAGALQLPVENLTISQNFSPNYREEEAYGRMDPIVSYKNTTRKININFSCQSHQYFDGHAGPVNNIHSVNILTQYLYPTYQNIPDVENAGQQQLAILKAPPFFRISFGNYIGSYNHLGEMADLESGLTGFITGFSHQLGALPKNVAHGRWFARTKDGKHWDETIKAVPREVKISFTFVVIHDKMVGWSEHNGKDRFSHEEYGQNFPYNVGNLAIEDAAREDYDAGMKSNAHDKLTAAKEGGNMNATQKKIDKAEMAADLQVENSNKKMGALSKVSDAQETAAMKKGSKGWQ